MTAAQRKQLQNLLIALEAELSGKPSVKLDPDLPDEQDSKLDEDAQPLNELLQAIESNRSRNQAGILVKVQKALRKLKEDPKSFGECEECGDELPFGRLKAVPFAEYCVNCQAGKDGPKAPIPRKHLTDYQD
jgi:DnaK suppressor protein